MLKWNKLIIALTTIFFMNTVIAKTRVEKKSYYRPSAHGMEIFIMPILMAHQKLQF